MFSGDEILQNYLWLLCASNYWVLSNSEYFEIFWFFEKYTKILLFLDYLWILYCSMEIFFWKVVHGYHGQLIPEFNSFLRVLKIFTIFFLTILTSYPSQPWSSKNQLSDNPTEAIFYGWFTVSKTPLIHNFQPISRKLIFFRL